MACGTDYRITSTDDINRAAVTPHVRTLMHTCWKLGGLPTLEPLHLRAWTHTLGFRGHILTKSRAYSTTYAALRAERLDHANTAHFPDDAETVTETHWQYLGSGHTSGAALIAAGVADDLAENRAVAREMRRLGD